MFYLAYGSNINSSEMKERCGNTEIEYVTSGYLDGFKLVFDGFSKKRKGLVADIRLANGSKTPFVLWRILSKEANFKLDSCEGFIKNNDPRNLYTKISIDIPGYSNVFAYVMTHSYIAKRGDCRTIPMDYVNTIRNGYKEFRLDETYLDSAILETSKL